jgi:hypothetical protein
VATEIASTLRVCIGLLLRRLRQAQDDGGLTLPQSAARRRWRASPRRAARCARISDRSIRHIPVLL